MKIIIVVTLLIVSSFAQDYKKYFDPNTTYQDKGIFLLNNYHSGNDKDDETYDEFKRINWRTVAVNPKKILPGSVIFIPEMVGYKIAENIYHDGYFFAHTILKDFSGSSIKIFTGNDAAKLKQKDVHVFAVQGAMAKSMRIRFEMQYSKKSEKPTYKMVASDFTQLMQEENSKTKDINQRIQFYSDLGKGTPYLVYNLGEGPSSIDPDPTIDFARTDCMTFCEHTLALAISNDYSDMYNNLQKIRYKNGLIGYTSRNHYTIVDWLPNNSWLLRDITAQIGKGLTKKMTKEIDRPAFYKNNGVTEKELENAPPKKKLTIEYIPTNSISKIQDSLQGGEIVSVITTHPVVFSAHMGIIVKDQWGNIIFRHASSRDQTSEVMDELLSDYLAQMAKSKTRVGMLFMRARQDYKIP